MKKLKLILVCFSMLAMSMSQCGSDEVGLGTAHESCFSGKPSKSVKDRKGVVYYDSEEKLWAVHAAHPGTYDSVDVGYICDKLDSLKKEGLVITFDGDFFPFKYDKKAVFVGTDYYYLDITKFKINRDH